MNRVIRRLVGIAAAATISVGVAAPVGLAQVQDPYGEQPPPVVQTPGGTIGFDPSPPQVTSADTSAQLKNCIKKAKKRFRNNPVKKKKAIKACTKKYG